MITLENAEIKLNIRPDLGGRLDRFQDLKTGKDWLWHPLEYDDSETRSLRDTRKGSLSLGASFDDNWTGGWDEIFPNDAAGEFRGYQLVDHGEFWSQSWRVADASPLSVKLIYACQTVPVSVEKTIQLNATQPEVTIAYIFRNQSDQTIPFLFKQHCAIAIQADDEILLPDCLIEPAFIEFSKIIGQNQKTRFPKAFAADGREIEVQKIPPKSSKLQEFYYCSDLAIGECGIRSKQSTFLMSFDTADFPYVWLFQSYGGWRDHYVLVMEPATTIPFDLEVASQNGTIAQLKPHASQQRTLTVKLQRF
ncbi:hypothetical protein [Phormidesmis sp. 146-33]